MTEVELLHEQVKELREALEAEHEAILVLKAWLRASPEERAQSHPLQITGLVNRAYLLGRRALDATAAQQSGEQ